MTFTPKWHAESGFEKVMKQIETSSRLKGSEE
jgi:hypothetical protein